MSTPAERSGPKWFTVYQDRFVIVYFLALGLYFLAGFAVLGLPLLDPGSDQRNLPRIGYLIVPMFWLAAITLSVIGVALRAAWALKLYPKLARPFFTFLVIASILTFLKYGLIGSIFITVVVVLISLPLVLIIGWGTRHLKRPEVKETFRSGGPDRP